MPDIYGIGIETSCDETGISIIKNGREIISNPLFSQIQTHKKYGGVVPELASRLHLEKFPYLIQSILNDFPFILNKVSYISVTVRPGLVGSLLTGYYIALAFKRVTNAPIIPVNHIEAHFYANQIAGEKFSFPFLGLLLSGGNSSFYLIEGVGKIKLLGDTLDDACGEAFDKAASMLGLNYPGGPEIEKHAMEFEKTINKKPENPLPYILKNMENEKYNFSFSGLKTALYYYLQKNPGADKNFLSWCFQERSFEIVLRNIKNIINNTGIKRLVAAGGVISNKTLNNKILELSGKLKFDFLSPPPSLCTDNGAMIGSLGYEYYNKSISKDYEKVISSKSEFS